MKIGISIALCLLLVGCTLSFQNISTNGKAADLVDQQQTASPDVSPTLVVPASAL